MVGIGLSARVLVYAIEPEEYVEHNVSGGEQKIPPDVPTRMNRPRLDKQINGRDEKPQYGQPKLCAVSHCCKTRDDVLTGMKTK